MNRLDELLILWQDQTLRPEEVEELKRLLEDPAARGQLADHFFTSGVIVDALREEKVAPPAPVLKWSPWVAWSAAAGLLIAFVAVLLVMNSSPGPAPQKSGGKPADLLSSRAETFRGKSVNTRFWTEQDPHQQMSVHNGLLFQGKKDGKVSTLRSRFQLKGDLDVEMDYELSSWFEVPDTQYVRLALIPPDKDAPKEFYIMRYQNRKTGLCASGWKEQAPAVSDEDPTVPVNWSSNIPTSSTRGQLRLTRTGTTIRSFSLEPDGAWREVFSHTVDKSMPVSLTLSARLIDAAARVRVTRVRIARGDMVLKP